MCYVMDNAILESIAICQKYELDVFFCQCGYICSNCYVLNATTLVMAYVKLSAMLRLGKETSKVLDQSLSEGFIAFLNRLSMK